MPVRQAGLVVVGSMLYTHSQSCHVVMSCRTVEFEEVDAGQSDSESLLSTSRKDLTAVQLDMHVFSLSSCTAG